MSISSPHHSFDINLAEKYSIEEAIMIHHFQHWIKVNHGLERGPKDGLIWTYQTLEEIKAHFPYWSIDQIKRIIQKLEKKKILRKGNFNKESWDRTIWYALEDQSFLNSHRDLAKSPNASGEIASPIPDTKTNTNTKDSIDSLDIEEKEDKEKEKKADKRPTASSISLNIEKRSFVGITPNDLQAWKEKFPQVNIDKELSLCAEWALGVPRKNYRKSILSWLTNVGKNSFKSPENKEFSMEDQNMIINRQWAREFKEIYREMEITAKYVKDRDLDSKEWSLNLPPATFQKTVYDHFYQKHHQEFEDACK